MKQAFYKSPLVHKWGLYICLLGSLGFNLSMNPEYQNFARNEPVQSFSYASEATEIKGKTQTIHMVRDGKAYSVTVNQLGSQTVAQFNPIDTEGKACENCGESRLITGASLDNIDKLTSTLSTVNLDSSVAPTADGPSEDAPAPTVAQAPAKPGERLNADIKKYAERCEESDDSLSCHKDSILKLSVDLKNSSEQKSLVNSYFQKYMAKDLKAGLSANRTSGSSGLSILSIGSMDETDAYSDYEAAQDIVRELVEKLESKNGEDVRKTAVKLSSESLRLQAAQAKKAMLDSFRGGDVIQDQAQFESGLNILNGLATEANDISSSLADAFKSTKASEITAFQNSVASAFKPVDTMLSDIQQNYFSMSRYNRNLLYSKVGVEALNKVSGIPGLPGSNGTVVPSQSGSLPANIAQQRSSVVRSYDSSGLMLLPGQTAATIPGTSLPSGQGPLQQQQGHCSAGYSGPSCLPDGQQQFQQQVPGGFQQQGSSGLPPAPRGAMLQRGG